MPIRIPDQLPATEQLESENIFVMTEHRAVHQDIRPLRVLLLNLMPKKIETETQIMRKLSNTPLQIEVELLHTISHESHNVSQEHLKTFYRSFDQVKDNRYDGMIITGAPVELHEFEDVDYWDELCRIMKWSTTNVHSTLHICWGAQAGIFYHYGIQKHELPKKLSGVFNHDVLKPSSPLVRGFDDRFWAPHSRHTTVDRGDIVRIPALKILAESEEAGVYAVSDDGGRQIFLMGHSEYDTNTLRDEYLRDKQAGLSPALPKNYFPGDDDTCAPVCSWRSSANLLFSNWLNYFVYQATPYDLTSIATVTE